MTIHVRISICTAALLTVLTGPLLVSYGSDEPLALLSADIAEDAEEDDDDNREVLPFHVAELIVELVHHSSAFRPISNGNALAIAYGPRSERGPPNGLSLISL